MNRYVISVVISLLLSSCGQSGSSSTELDPPAVDVTGVWMLTLEGSDARQELPLGYFVRLDMVQNGVNLSGTAETSDERAGSVAGIVSGNTIVDFTVSIDPLPAQLDPASQRQTMSGTAEVSGDRLTLELSVDLGAGDIGSTTRLVAQAAATKLE